jgi:hypothetical protein
MQEPALKAGFLLADESHFADNKKTEAGASVAFLPS